MLLDKDKNIDAKGTKFHSSTPHAEGLLCRVLEDVL